MRRLVSALAAALLLAAAPADVVTQVRAWRQQHEKEILRELFDFLSIPNVAADAPNIKRNADALARMFERRRFAPELIAGAGPPLVVAERRLPNTRRTITFYFHYDGQPVNAAEWIYEPPFKPVIVAPHEPQGRTITLETWRGAVGPGGRGSRRRAPGGKPAGRGMPRPIAR